MRIFRRIVHPSDFSPASRPAFVKALALAKANRAELLLIHVIDPAIPVPDQGYVSPKAYEQIRATAHAFGQRQLDRLLARARNAGVRAKSRLLEGVPHEQIVRAARSARADLLAMGTHGRTGLARLFLGSVAARVIALSSCPVLTVRAR